MYKGLILTSSGIRRDTEDHIVTKLSEKRALETRAAYLGAANSS